MRLLPILLLLVAFALSCSKNRCDLDGGNGCIATFKCHYIILGNQCYYVCKGIDKLQQLGITIDTEAEYKVCIEYNISDDGCFSYFPMCINLPCKDKGRVIEILSAELLD